MNIARDCVLRLRAMLTQGKTKATPLVNQPGSEKTGRNAVFPINTSGTIQTNFPEDGKRPAFRCLQFESAELSHKPKGTSIFSRKDRDGYAGEKMIFDGQFLSDYFP